MGLPRLAFAGHASRRSEARSPPSLRGNWTGAKGPGEIDHAARRGSGHGTSCMGWTSLDVSGV